MARTPKPALPSTPARPGHQPKSPAIEQPAGADAGASAEDSPPAQAKRDREPKRQADATAALPPDPGEGAAAEASPAAAGPSPDAPEDDALIAEMASPVSGEPDGGPAQR